MFYPERNFPVELKGNRREFSVALVVKVNDSEREKKRFGSKIFTMKNRNFLEKKFNVSCRAKSTLNWPSLVLTSAKVRSTVPRPSTSSRSHSRINRSAIDRSRSVFLCLTLEASFHSSGVNRCGRVTILAMAIRLLKVEIKIVCSSNQSKQIAINNERCHRKFSAPKKRKPRRDVAFADDRQEQKKEKRE